LNQLVNLSNKNFFSYFFQFDLPPLSTSFAKSFYEANNAKATMEWKEGGSQISTCGLKIWTYLWFAEMRFSSTTILLLLSKLVNVISSMPIDNPIRKL
jgi:hypothetical protein